MYKTVRQGDNCLQYHILPQDDVTSGHVMKRRRPPRSRTALVLVITLVLGCAIVAAAVLIPVLMRANVVALPARFQTFAVAASSVKMGGRGKYALQGTQYIALLPVKDSSGHFNAYQLKPSFHSTTTTSTTTTTTTTTVSPSTTVTDVFRIPEPGARTGNNDPDRPQNTTPVETRGPERPLNPYMPWMVSTSTLFLFVCPSCNSFKH